MEIIGIIGVVIGVVFIILSLLMPLIVYLIGANVGKIRKQGQEQTELLRFIAQRLQNLEVE